MRSLHCTKAPTASKTLPQLNHSHLNIRILDDAQAQATDLSNSTFSQFLLPPVLDLRQAASHNHYEQFAPHDTTLAAPLAWGPVRPEQVEMRYWLTAAPAAPISFRYDGAQHDRARRLLHQQIATILSGENEADFPKVEDTPANRKRFCNFCVYRSRCNRGATAGDVDEILDPTDYFSGDVAGSLEFTMDEVEELAF